MKTVRNYENNTIELYFEEKPNEFVRETLKLYRWRWNPNKKCWSNRYSEENMMIAQTIEKSAGAMEGKKVPETYIAKKNQEKSNNSYTANLVDNLFKQNDERKQQAKSEVQQTVKPVKKSSLVKKKEIDFDDDSFELDL